MVGDGFFEIPEGQIHIFPRFRACQLCEFHMVIRGPWAFLREVWAPPGAQKWALEGSRGGPEKRGQAPEALQGGSGERKLSSLGVFYFPYVLETL